MRALTLVLVLGAALAIPLTANASDTLWIFDATFDDLNGDNAGWLSEDLSGTLAITNYWHKDTIRINGFEWLGDSTWWCGTVNPCWRQPRGYGNDWVCSLQRTFPLDAWSASGDTLTLEWDQRIAMEQDYDYGYVDVSTDGGATWITEHVATNPGFQSPGWATDWDHWQYGHQTVDLSNYAGSLIDLRFRFESDCSYSPQDQYDNPPVHSVQDGAWQIDNIEWKVNGSTVWLDDCESPGDNGWTHEDIPGVGQIGVVFERRYLEDLGAPGDPRSGWVMAAFDTAVGATVPDELAFLFSPPIDIGGLDDLVGEWTAYVDCPTEHAFLGVLGSDRPECILESAGGFDDFDDYDIYGQLGWASATYDWSAYGGSAPWWISVGILQSTEGEPHGMGFVLDRLRVGVPLTTGAPDSRPAMTLSLHPNPFNPTTTIEYSLATSGRVTLAVYGLTGRLVATLVDAVQAAGPHETTWDGATDAGSRAASGVYFVRLTTGTTEATGRLVLLK